MAARSLNSISQVPLLLAQDNAQIRILKPLCRANQENYYCDFRNC
jgi:hypothetical protein